LNQRFKSNKFELKFGIFSKYNLEFGSKIQI
jgi:hypothetical protein